MRLVPFVIGALSIVTALWLGGCGGGGDKREAAVDTKPVDYGASRDFPVPPEIEPNVNFWRNVYGVWGRNKVAFHDDEHMGVIYEVAQLPGPTLEGYTEQQRAFVRARQAYYQDTVRDLARKLSSGSPLSSEEQSILAKFEQNGGRAGVYGAAERVRTQRGLRDRFRRGLEISGRYDKSFREIMRTNGLPEDLAYLPHVESSFQSHAVSSAGATGIWQFMPATGRSYMNVNGAVDDRLCPIVSAEGAARYLSQAHSRLGTWPLAITSYNHGQGGMANAKAQFGNDFGSIVKNYQGKAFKFASRNYYAEFIAAREVAGHPDRYFPEGIRYESPWPHERLILASTMPADAVARHYGLSTVSLASANPHWRSAARDGRTDLPAGTTVWLPSGSKARAGAPAGYGGALAGRGSFGRPATEAAAAAAFRATKAEPVRLEYSDRDAYPPNARAESGFDPDGGRPVRRAVNQPRVEPTPAASDSPLAQLEPRRAQEASMKLPVAEEWHTQYEPQVSGNAPVRGRRGRVDAVSPWPEPTLAAAAPRSVRSEPSAEPPAARTFAAEPEAAPRVAAVPRAAPAPAEPKLAEPKPAVPDGEPSLAEASGDLSTAVTPPVSRTEPRVAAVPVAETRAPARRLTETRIPDPRLAEPRLADLDSEEPSAREADLEAAEPEAAPVRRSARTESAADRSEPKVARAERRTAKAASKPVPAEAKSARSEPKVAKADAEQTKSARVAKADGKAEKAERSAKAATKDAKTDAKAAKIAQADVKDAKAARTPKDDAKTAKADAKTAKADAKTAKADAKTAKADAKTAKTDAKTAKADAKTAKADASAGKPDAKTAKADAKTGKPDAKTAKAEKGGASKVHVVKSQETLFRVASGNGISVEELRRLNKIGPNDNHVRPGQKLKVGT